MLNGRERVWSEMGGVRTSGCDAGGNLKRLEGGSVMWTAREEVVAEGNAMLRAVVPE